MQKIRTIADIEAIEAVSLASRLDGIDCTYDVIRKSAALTPSAPALVGLDEQDCLRVQVELSYEDLLAHVTRAANAFTSLGVGAEDVVSFLLPNLPETHFTFWGGEAAGIANPINWYLEPSQIAEIMNAAGTRILVAAGSSLYPDIWRKAEAVRKLVPSLTAIVQVYGDDRPEPGVFSFERLLRQQPETHLINHRRIRGSDVAAYFHTGGTTGAPKLAQHTHFNQVSDALMATMVLDLGPKDAAICGLPLFHVNAMIMTGLASFMAGARVILAGSTGYRNKSVVKSFWDIVEMTQATLFSAVPSVYAALLNEPIGDKKISSLRYGMCGAAPMPAELFRRFETVTGIRILEGYGLTEGTCMSSANPRDGKRKIGSIGLRAPYQDMKVAVLDEPQNFVRDCRVDEIGSLLIKGPNVFHGYKEEAHNKRVWAAPDWLNTGDLARQDADGFFWLAGRLKELIIRGGHNIDPAIIEEAMLKHPMVNTAAAVGKPDAYAGELPVAFVTLKQNAVVDAPVLLEHARIHVPERAAVPVEVFIVESLPLTAVGKIFKPQLRYQAAQVVLQRALEGCCRPDIQLVVAVGAHARHGTAAVIRVSGWTRQTREATRMAVEARVGTFHTPYSIDWGDSAA